MRKLSQGTGPDGEPTIVQLIVDGEIDLIVNTPFGAGSRLDGYEIRTAAVQAGKPCITTVQGFAAAVQGSRRSSAARSGSARCRSTRTRSTPRAPRARRAGLRGLIVSN